MKFEWDPAKDKLNQLKHDGISFEQASYVFSDPYALSKYDEEHSQHEDRWILLGKALNEVLLVVVHTYRNSNSEENIRLISARKATKLESRFYNQRLPK